MLNQLRLSFLLFCGLTVLLLAACKATSFPFNKEDEMSIPFEVCAQSEIWQRPSETKQKVKWWDDGRYLGADEAILRGMDSPWQRTVFLDYGNASPAYDQMNLSGLWTATEEREDIFAACYEKERHYALTHGKTIRLWLLFGQVQSIKQEGREYKVVVKPTEAGFQWVDIPRPDTTEDLTFRVIRNDGEPLGILVETGLNNWRYGDSQLSN
jgi:acyl-CoA synthetase (AMP-forming)/AMP-acid ligase II